MNESTPRRRYAGFVLDLSEIHPLKRLMRLVSFCLPRKLRFFVFGLPASGENDIRPGGQALAEIPRGIASALGANLSANGTYIPELTGGAGAYVESRFLKKQRCFPRIRQDPAAVVSLVGNGDSNYYCWLIETLPRLRFLGAQSWPIYACQKREFHRESLRLLISGGSEVFASDRIPYLRAGRLFVPRLINESETWIVPWLREKILPHLPPASPAEGPKRLYLSRRKATGRRISNEGALLELLGEFGFLSVTPEDLGWLDQVALFQRAEAIVAPHGAGLANLVFGRPSLRVMELIATGYPFTFYPQISAQLHVEHQTVSGEPIDPAKINSSDLAAPLDRVRAMLREWFS